MKLRYLLFPLAFACSALALTPTAATAAALIFDDTSPSDTITVSANDFEGGLIVNGSLLQLGLGSPASTTVPEGPAISFLGTWIDLGASGAGSRTLYLVEAFDPTIISDILEYTWSTDGFFGTIVGSFISDTNNNLGLLPGGVNPADVFVENGLPVSFSLPFLGGEIRSDVPEPGSLALLLLGLLPLVAARKQAV